MLIIALLFYYVYIVSRFSLKNIYMYYQEISCSKMLHFPFRIQLENQGSSLNPTQNAGATQLSGMSGEIGDGRHELETTRQPRRTECAYTMLSQCTMVSLACEQALCLGKKIARKGKGKGGREPVDKHLRPLFRSLVIILPIICQ